MRWLLLICRPESCFSRPEAVNVVDDFVYQARRAHELGVRQVWLAQRFDHDAFALAGLIGAAVPGFGVGTFVVPINPRHPLIVASLAQTAQAASHGNFSLGLGLGAHEPERLVFGTDWPNTIRRLREHLAVLRSVFDAGTVDFHGDELTASPAWPVAVAGGTPIPIYVAAMGPRHYGSPANSPTAHCLSSLGRGPSPSSSNRPSRRRLPMRAGRSPNHRRGSRLVSDDVDAARNFAAQQLSFYETIPSYQRSSLERAWTVPPSLRRSALSSLSATASKSYLDAGATDVVLSPLDRADDADRRIAVGGRRFAVVAKRADGRESTSRSRQIVDHGGRGGGDNRSPS